MIADWTLTLADGVGEVEFDVLAKVEDNDYSWSAEAVLRRKTDGALFFATDSGCSCYGFGELINVSDLKPLRKFEDALRLLDDPLDRERLKRSFETGEGVYR